ncbi:MAG: hypothetical protein O2899_06050 [Bacteroidetes bacterium]|nr:hypothetical protein [Bacteroidota bacterium]
MMANNPLRGERTDFPHWKARLRWFATELAMIVTGILVALAINTWWQGRETAQREQSYLADLVLDFEENALRLEEAIKEADEVLEASQILLGLHSAAAGRAIGTDSLNYLLQTLSILPTFQPVTRTWDDILGAGELQTLSNPELRMLLADFESQMRLVGIVEGTQEDQLVSLFVPYIMEHLDYAAAALFSSETIEYPEERYAYTIYGVLGTREFRNWVVLRMTWADDLQGVHMVVLEVVKDVRAELEREVE